MIPAAVHNLEEQYQGEKQWVPPHDARNADVGAICTLHR